MNNTLPDNVLSIHGFLSPAEANWLHQAAQAVPVGGVIVEIGSFQGKSTVCLGLGAKQSGARVYAIDPHENCQEGSTHYGMENHAALLMHLILHEVADVVRVIAMPSASIADVWWTNLLINLLWVDGSHEYQDVRSDLLSWSSLMTPNGRIAVHDSNGHYPGVSRALTEFTMSHYWKVDQRIDAMTVLVRDV